MSEARALTNFSGNAVATLVIGNWVKEIDRPQADRVFSGEDPFDDLDMLDEHSAEEHRADVEAYKHKSTVHEHVARQMHDPTRPAASTMRAGRPGSSPRSNTASMSHPRRKASTWSRARMN